MESWRKKLENYRYPFEILIREKNGIKNIYITCMHIDKNKCENVRDRTYTKKCDFNGIRVEIQYDHYLLSL